MHYKWSFSIAMLNYQRVITYKNHINHRNPRLQVPSEQVAVAQALIRPKKRPVYPWEYHQFLAMVRGKMMIG